VLPISELLKQFIRSIEKIDQNLYNLKSRMVPLNQPSEAGKGKGDK
jgi:hypothetical protein